MPDVALPQGTIRYREAGPADGPPVVLVHGALVDGAIWDGVADGLAARGLRAIVPTLPLGAHELPLPAGADRSPRGLAALIAAFLEALGLEDVTLAGNDSGGALCQFVLDRHPERVGRLVLTDCDGFDTFPPFPFDLVFRVARRPALFRPVMAAARWTPLRHSPLAYGPLTERPIDPALTRRWVERYLASAGVREDFGAFCRAIDPRELAEVSAGLGRFEGPALLLWAPADRYFTIALGRRLQAALADARLVEIADARTVVPLDQPARVAGEIAAFVGAPVAA